MGDFSEFSMAVRLFLKAYPWRRIDPVPWAPLKKPLGESTISLVSSAGFVLDGQTPFDESVRGGDWSFREIPLESNLSDLKECHRSESFDHSGIQSDPNLAFPLERLRELAARGRIGAASLNHISFMGSMTALGRFMRESVPAIADRMQAVETDVALLVPV